MARPLKEIIHRLRLYLQITHMGGIARRYFIMNGFDGAMTMLGVILGAWVAGIQNPGVVITTGLGGCLALGVSGVLSAYMAERAERARRMKALEEALLTSLNHTLHDRAFKFTSAYVALVNGMSPMLTALISITPFILSSVGVFLIADAYITSLILNLVTLFSLGIYLGRVAKENIWLYGAQMVAAGLVTIVIIVLLGMLSA